MHFSGNAFWKKVFYFFSPFFFLLNAYGMPKFFPSLKHSLSDYQTILAGKSPSTKFWAKKLSLKLQKKICVSHDVSEEKKNHELELTKRLIFHCKNSASIYGFYIILLVFIQHCIRFIICEWMNGWHFKRIFQHESISSGYLLISTENC